LVVRDTDCLAVRCPHKIGGVPLIDDLTHNDTAIFQFIGFPLDIAERRGRKKQKDETEKGEQ